MGSPCSQCLEHHGDGIIRKKLVVVRGEHHREVLIMRKFGVFDFLEDRCVSDQGVVGFIQKFEG